MRAKNSYLVALRLSPALRVLSFSVMLIAGCSPAPYSEDFKGQVVDYQGHPLKDAFVVSEVLRRCGSLGGGSSELLKSSVVSTDADGRYQDHISGMSTFYTFLIGGCGSFQTMSVACKAGFKPSGALAPIGDVARLSPGEGWSFMSLPPQCSSALVTEAHDKAAAIPRPSGKLDENFDLPLWTPGLHLKGFIHDPMVLSPVTDVVTPKGALYWLEIEERFVGGKTFPVVTVVPSNSHYRKQMGWLGYERITSSIIPLGLAHPNASAVSSSTTHSFVWTDAEPMGGVQLTLHASGSSRVDGPMKFRALDKKDWLHLRTLVRDGKPLDALAEEHVHLYNPKGVSIEDAPVRVPERYAAPVRSNERMTMPLWAERSWLYPVIQDPGGASAPYPSMPVVRIQSPGLGAASWLVVTEVVDSVGRSRVEVSREGENNLFYTKNDAESDGRHRTYVFALKPASPGCKPLRGAEPPNSVGPGGFDPHIRLQPAGGVRWTIEVSKGARVEHPLFIESVLSKDWTRFKSEIAAFDKLPDQWQNIFCDPD